MPGQHSFGSDKKILYKRIKVAVQDVAVKGMNEFGPGPQSQGGQPGYCTRFRGMAMGQHQTGRREQASRAGHR